MELASLWNRYLDWLYQHKELRLYIDVSQIRFTDEFVEAMEPKFQSAFKALEELEFGLIANPNEGRMVGHYWLSKSSISPNPNLRQQINRMLDAICKFVDDVINVKDDLSAQSIARFLLPTSQCEFILNLVLEELQKHLWAVEIDARATRCIGTALSMATGLVGACVPDTTA
ncbi:hypothetical protein SUGI_0358960 [Cryptomeria japonica]|nr:hypothetical protein SUGI_0358960 [Cryptomeria japonica]